MKKLLRTIGALLLATALVFAFIPASDVEAATSTSDFQMEGAKLVKYVGTAEVVSLPDNVRSIGEEAFAGNPNIVKVKINSKCQDIGYGAFQNCVGLRSVTMGDEIEEIGSAAFANDPVLSEVTLGASVKSLGNGVFAGDCELKKLNISPENTRLVLEDDILYDSKYSKIYLMLPTYKDNEYKMSNSVEEIMGYAFWGNENLKNVTLSSNLNVIPEYAFSNCKALKQVTIPLPVRTIQAKAFEDCVNLSLVICPESLTSISDNAFDGCPKVTLSAKEGTYAYDFSQDLMKKRIDEIEYEDTDEAQIVSQNRGQITDATLFGENDVEVQSGAPQGDNASGQEKNGNPNSETGEADGNQGAQATSQPQATPAAGVTEARYAAGVINGADVVTYTYYDPSKDPTGNLMGASSIVAGRAVVFIDNANVRNFDSQSQNTIDLEQPVVSTGENRASAGNGNASGNENVEGTGTSNNNSSDETVTLAQALNLGTLKGNSFPKFTVVGDKIASQAYYMDTNLSEYKIPENITEIGNFAFARSGLTAIDIPEGVEEIGLGAFYHCDNLNDVNIPSSVKSIKGYAFDETAFVKNYPGEFVIVGDGVLIAYKGADSVVTIPEGVKLIADGTFRDHLGITAVNLADTLEVIGEDAFNGCTNLKTLNRGDNVTTIGANAFKGTSLSKVTINPNVKTIGTGAFDLSQGADSVMFLGETIPVLASGTSAERLANDEDRAYAFGDMSTAIIPDGVTNLNGTVLEPGKFGFHGKVVDEEANVVSDNTSGVFLKSEPGIVTEVNSAYIDGGSVSAKMPGNDGAFNLHISDSQNAREQITNAYSELYGGRVPEQVVGVNICLKDASDTVDICKLGKQTVDVYMDIPAGLSPDNLHAVALDEDGQLEAVGYTLSEDKKSLKLECTHFSFYGFYNYAGLNGEGITKTGDHVKDITPDTGDYSIAPKWFLVIGLIASSVVMFLLSFGRKEDGAIPENKTGKK